MYKRQRRITIKKKQEVKNLFVYLKYSALLILIIYLATTFLNSLNIDINLNFILIGYFITILIAFFLHFFTYKIATLKMKNRKTTKVKLSIMRSLKYVLLLLISPDYLFAELFKGILNNNEIIKIQEKNIITNSLTTETLEERKRDLKRDFIIFSNWFNFALIIVLTILVVNLLPIQQNECFLYILIIRLLSRSIEISSAFYGDVVRVRAKRKEEGVINNWKQSSIRKPQRISLAIHSLVEIILSFALLYYFLIQFKGALPYLFKSMNGHTFLDFLFFSTSLSFFNFSFVPEYNIWEKFLHVWQLLVSVNLIVLSIASYIGLEDRFTNHDEKRFSEKNL